VLAGKRTKTGKSAYGNYLWTIESLAQKGGTGQGKGVAVSPRFQRVGMVGGEPSSGRELYHGEWRIKERMVGIVGGALGDGLKKVGILPSRETQNYMKRSI